MLADNVGVVLEVVVTRVSELPISAAVARPRRARWLRGPVTDWLLALLWVPFAAAAAMFDSDPARLQALVAATLTLSFAHQPLTLALVYGDRSQFASRARLFILAPVVLLALVAAGQQVSLVLLAAVAAVWNAGHTLMQRYGVLRIYGRKTGDTDGRLDRAMLWSWLALALVWAAAASGTPDRIERVDLSARNQRGFELLTAMAPVARLVLPVVALVAVALLVAWIDRQRHLTCANPASWPYVASTAALFGVLLVNPIAGFVGYVGAHAVEYFVLVWLQLDRRYPDEHTDGGALVGRAVRARSGSLGFFAGYAAAIAILLVILEWQGSSRLTALVVLTLGGMHLLYDGVIWKLRRPEVSRGFEIH